EIDAHSADRRHRMRRIPDAEKPRPPPSIEPVDTNSEQPHVLEARDLAETFGKKRRQLCQSRTKRVDAGRPDAIDPSLRNHVRALPVIAPIEHDHEAP